MQFPLLQLGGVPAALQLTAGQHAAYDVTVTNTGEQPCIAEWQTACSWAHIQQPRRLLEPAERATWRVILAPPAALRVGSYTIPLHLQAGRLMLITSLTGYVASQGLWQRVRQWFNP
jgi:hypothetical protein